MMTKLYLLSKSIHRYLLIVIILLTIIMAGTGSIMKYGFIGKMLQVDAGMVRYIHGNISTAFTIILFLMMCTGVVMYIFPLLRKKPPTDSPVDQKLVN